MFAEGRVHGDEGLQMAEAVAHPASLMLAARGMGLLALRQGDLPRALPLLQRALSLCQDVDLPVFFPWVAGALGAAYALVGRAADAVSLLTQAVAQITAVGHAYFARFCCLALGEAQTLVGLLEEAHALVEQTLALARAHQERGHEAYALRLLGDIATHRSPPERALAVGYYQQALALAEELGMRPLQAHCRRGLGTLYSLVGRLDEARAALSTALHMYRAMEMALWLPQVEATLAQTGGRAY
jgi:tetratricopeptide (TPR) repeat protein